MSDIKMKTLVLESKNKELKSEIIKFFKKNPYPKDSKVHALAEKLKISPDALETTIYAILSDLLKWYFYLFFLFILLLLKYK